MIIETLEPSKIISLIVGAGMGFLAVLLWLIKHRKRDRVKRCRRLRYGDLVEFAQNCQRQFVSARKSRVACEVLQNGKYQLTQLILDENSIAIHTAVNSVLARIVICDELDDKIHVLLKTNNDGFDFQI